MGLIKPLFDMGAESERNMFWDKYQNYGNRTYYDYAFCNYNVYRGDSIDTFWNNETFRPKYDITIKFGSNCFRANKGLGNFKQKLLDWGINLNFVGVSGDQMLYYLFAESDITHGPDLYAPNEKNASYTFKDCTELIDAGTITVSSSNTWTQTFSNCPNLEQVRFTNSITRSISFSSSPKLSHETLIHIINKMGSASASNKNLTLGSVNISKLTDEEIAIATNKGWVVS